MTVLAGPCGDTSRSVISVGMSTTTLAKDMGLSDTLKATRVHGVARFTGRNSAL